ncbi:MAG: putative DNA binding domain-containing protein [Burkholderiaceae bacterium]
MNGDFDPSAELEVWRALPAETEWLEFKSARENLDTDELGRYVSALANEASLAGRAAGWLVLGVMDRRDAATGLRPVCGTRFALDTTHRNRLKRLIAEGTSPTVSLADAVQVAHAECAAGSVVAMRRVPAAPAGMPVAWKGHFYGRDGESLGALALHELEAIRAQAASSDWSAGLVHADVGMIDPRAMTRARELYRRRHASHAHVLAEEALWDDREFVHRLRLAQDGSLTRAALLLLGRPEAAMLLAGPRPRLTWLLVDHAGQEAAQPRHFGLPLLLAIDALVDCIRIVDVPLLPPGQLAPLNLPNYDDWVLREALHNCIAHQDYTQGGRVRVCESPSTLTFFNLGAFLPGSVERVLMAQQPEHRYRNACLADAMVELDLIETINSGLPKMFRIQRQRFFPLPDFTLANDPPSVSVRIHGKVIDPNYVRALMSDRDITLEQAIQLDRVQKGLPIDAMQAKALRARGLVEGRLSRLTVSASVAALTGNEVEYVERRGLDEDHFKALVRKLLATGPQPRSKIDALLLPKLPGVLAIEAERRDYVRRLLQSMRESGLIVNVGKRTRGAQWALTEAANREARPPIGRQ